MLINELHPFLDFFLFSFSAGIPIQAGGVYRKQFKGALKLFLESCFRKIDKFLVGGVVNQQFLQFRNRQAILLEQWRFGDERLNQDEIMQVLNKRIRIFNQGHISEMLL